MYKEYQVRIYDDGHKEWYLNDKRHREGGPAIEWVSGSKIWCLNGKLHREDGPAIEWISGAKEWWLHGKQVSQDEVESNHTNKVVEFDGKKYKLVREL